MARVTKAISAVVGLTLGALLFTGCSVINELLALAPNAVPAPTLPTAAPPLEKIYQGGSRPDGLTEDEWATKSQRRIIAVGALHGVVVYGVDHETGSDAITVKIKGDPADAQLLADVEQYVVPVALSWSPTVTVIIDPSLCGVVGEVRDDTPVCDALTNP